MEQLNIEGKRSGDGFVCHRELLVSALAKAQAPKVSIIGVTLARKGLLNYIRLLGGSNIVKVIPSNGGLKVLCGANTSNLAGGAWVTEKTGAGLCEVRVSPHSGIQPNLGGIELAEALSRVIPFIKTGKDTALELECIRLAQKEGRLTLASVDGFRLAEVSLPFEDGEGQALILASELKGIVSTIRKARRVRLSLNGNLIVNTEAITCTWESQKAKFPDYEKLFPTDWVATARFDTREMVKASSSINALSLDRQAPVILTIGEGKVKVTVKDDKGETEVQAETEGEGQIAVNARYLLQVLKACGGMVELKVKDPQAPMVFSVDGYRILVMPVDVKLGRGDGEKPAEAVAEVEPTVEGEAEVETVAEEKPKRRQKVKA